MMGKIEDFYYDWAENQTDTDEIRRSYNKLDNILTNLLGKKKSNDIDGMIMECVLLEREQAFKGGFKEATAIWRECY